MVNILFIIFEKSIFKFYINAIIKIFYLNLKVITALILNANIII